MYRVGEKQPHQAGDPSAKKSKGKKGRIKRHGGPAVFMWTQDSEGQFHRTQKGSLIDNQSYSEG
jgi:hypothetical protein